MRGLPKLLWLVALLAALLHIAPVWRAAWNTPPGWTFTGNLSVSPDVMQYRVWERQAAAMGPVVDNRLTSEPNRPHLIVLPYYAYAKLGAWLGVSPLWVENYAGCVLAFAFTILLFITVRTFLPDPRQCWTVFLVVLLGGGLGAHLKILAELQPLHRSYVFTRLVAEPLAQWPVFENYRGLYVVKTLLDTHFLLLWIVALGAVLALYHAIVRFTPWRVAVAVALSIAMTVLHVYEGVTLVCITAGVALCCWRRGVAARPVFVVLALQGAAVAACYLLLMRLYQRSGLPVPEWRAVNILFATLVIAFPVAWVLIALGHVRYWREAARPHLFLIGWAGGCTALTLAGPFYPYPDRGAMTLQVVLYIIAGAIWFALRPRPARWVAALCVVALAATPVWLLAANWRYSAFQDDAPYMYQNGSHRRVLDALARAARPDDVLLTEPADALWLAPEYPGRLYVAHFFLTVDFERKQRELEAFFDAAPDAQRALLERTRTRFLFVSAARHPERVAEIPGVRAVVREPIGWLLEFGGQVAAVRGAHLGATLP